MKILNVEQIRQWDQYTIQHEPIASIDLMERAARRWTRTFMKQIKPDYPIYIFAGQGNNGGDGLAIARMLYHEGYDVQVYQLWLRDRLSPDNQINLQRWQQRAPDRYHRIQSEADFPEIPESAIVIDALWGSGLQRPLEGLAAQLVNYISQRGWFRVAVDIPSGLFADQPPQEPVFHAHWTITFQVPKLSFLLPRTGQFVGDFTIVDIGLLPDFLQQVQTPYYYVTRDEIQPILRPRQRWDHKGTLGHALIIAGSQGKLGAAILATQGALASGAGLVTTHLPQVGFTALHAAAPAAMVSNAGSTLVEVPVPDWDRYSALGIGPGLGTEWPTRSFMDDLLDHCPLPMVLDADALNLIAREGWQQRIPVGAILTPHPGEWRRLAGEAADDFAQLQQLRQFAMNQQVWVVLKQAHTVTCAPDGSCWFNSTGNPILATGGSGDVLLGLVAGLRARGYGAHEAALLAVYLHGLAGDLARNDWDEEAFHAGLLPEYINQAWQIVKQ